MKSLACATIVLFAGCTQPHDTALQEVMHGSDCVACHLPQYQATTNPVHAGKFPTTCGDCHATTAWIPALAGGHPEAAFPIASGAHQIPCLTCHDPTRGSSVAGANTSCVGCHTGDHMQPVIDPLHGGVLSYAWDASQPHFCLTCHPDGRSAKHPESLFPIMGGSHGGIACGTCHDKNLGPSTGGQNTNCIQCHTAAQNNGRHANVRNYVFSTSTPHFCLTCHPRG